MPMIDLENIDRYRWIQLPDNSGYILIDTKFSRQVDGVFYRKEEKSNVEIDYSDPVRLDDVTTRVSNLEDRFIASTIYTGECNTTSTTYTTGHISTVSSQLNNCECDNNE